MPTSTTRNSWGSTLPIWAWKYHLGLLVLFSALHCFAFPPHLTTTRGSHSPLDPGGRRLRAASTRTVTTLGACVVAVVVVVSGAFPQDVERAVTQTRLVTVGACACLLCSQTKAAFRQLSRADFTGSRVSSAADCARIGGGRDASKEPQLERGAKHDHLRKELSLIFSPPPLAQKKTGRAEVISPHLCAEVVVVVVVVVFRAKPLHLLNAVHEVGDLQVVFPRARMRSGNRRGTVTIGERHHFHSFEAQYPMDLAAQSRPLPSVDEVLWTLRKIETTPTYSSRNRQHSTLDLGHRTPRLPRAT